MHFRDAAMGRDEARRIYGSFVRVAGECDALIWSMEYASPAQNAREVGLGSAMDIVPFMPSSCLAVQKWRPATIGKHVSSYWLILGTKERPREEQRPC